MYNEVVHKGTTETARAAGFKAFVESTRPGAIRKIFCDKVAYEAFAAFEVMCGFSVNVTECRAMEKKVFFQDNTVFYR